ncbi:MAG: helix-turn-helix domain-containing protein [Betaproteobacteria bacterium]
MKEFRPAKKRIAVSVGESVRIVRELQGLSQNQLAERTGIPQATLSAIENDRVRLGVERAKVLARALKGSARRLLHVSRHDLTAASRAYNPA